MDKTTCKKTEYVSPRLIRYGDVRTITQTAGNMGAVADGGGGGMDKTS